MTRYWFICAVSALCLHSNVGFDVSMEWKYSRFANTYESFETLYHKNDVTIKFDNNTRTLLLKCLMGNKITDVISPFKPLLSVKQLIIDTCTLPAAPIVETLKALNINTTVEMLLLGIPSIKPLPPANYMQGLSVQTLWIDDMLSPIRDVLANNTNILEPLSNLTTLIVYANSMVPLPENVHLEVLSLAHNAWTERWERCEYLRELRIHNLDHYEIPKQWPENCTQLKTIRLRGLTTVGGEQVVSTLGKACGNLTTLYMQSCNQSDLPHDILHTAKGLVYLNLTRNRILDQGFETFPLMSNLTHLDLSINYLSGWFLTKFVEKTPALRYLNLANNKFTNIFCDFEGNTRSLATIPSLQWLSFNQMPLRASCFAKHRFPNLKFLGLATTENIVDFGFRDLPRTNSKHLEVDLRGNVVLEISPYSKAEYEAAIRGKPTGFWTHYETGRLYDNTNVTLLISYLDCDCKHYWLSRALRESHQNYVSLPGVRCEKSKLEFTNEPLSNMNCVKDISGNCVTRNIGTYDTEEAKEHKLTVECHNSKDDLKIWFSDDGTLIGLNVSHGQISTLQKISPFPDSIQWIDLRNNNISRLDYNDLALLFSNPERRVWLKGNTIFCDCANKPLLDALHEHHEQVVDYNELICLETGTPLQSVTSYEVCQIGLKLAIGICGALIVLLLIVAFLLWRYRLQVRIYLYSRGWCLFCLREDDEDRPYDAFLSFAHGDDQYVMEKLLPKLEGEPDFYRVCVHYRDWVVGDWIPSQIMRSVQESKRTIIVLSKNFLGSMWGNLEFRYAVACAAEERRSRLLVLIVGDVLSEKLDAELQGYLSFNTYLHCDDPWFWEKLRYAMPRRKHTPKKRVDVDNVPDIRSFLHLTETSRQSTNY